MEYDSEEDESEKDKIARHMVISLLDRGHPDFKGMKPYLQQLEDVQGSEAYFRRNPNSILFEIDKNANSDSPERRKAAFMLSKRLTKIIHDENDETKKIRQRRAKQPSIFER